MTFSGRLPSRVFAVGDHVSHERRRRRAAEAEWLTDKWQNKSRVSLSLPPPPLSWRTRSQDQGSGSSHCSLWQGFTMNSNVQKLSSQDNIFQWWLSARLDICFGHRKIPCVSVFDQQPWFNWRWVSRLWLWRCYRLGLVVFHFRSGTFGFIEVGIYCQYISLATSHSFLMGELCVTHHFQVCPCPLSAVSLNSAWFIRRHLLIQVSLQLTWKVQVMANS